MPAPPWLAISVVTADDGVQVVSISGEVDIATAPLLSEALTATIRAGGTADIMVDLTALTFLAAAGLTAFVAAHDLAKRSGRVLRARHPQGEVDTVLRVTDLADLLQIGDIPTAAHTVHRVTGSKQMIL